MKIAQKYIWPIERCIEYALRNFSATLSRESDIGFKFETLVSDDHAFTGQMHDFATFGQYFYPTQFYWPYLANGPFARNGFSARCTSLLLLPRPKI